MKKLLNTDLKVVSFLFIIWKLVIYGAFLIAFAFIPIAGKHFFGGGLEKYTANPFLFSWANFDGEHYLSIAQIGYKGLEQAFFPIYPLLMHTLAEPFGLNLFSLTIAGLLISNLSFLFAIILLWRLIRIDYSYKIALFTLTVLLIFPTSFYFGAVYSESIFLLLSVASFYSARKKRWLLAALFGAVASATRIFGILILPALILEILTQKQPLKKVFWIAFIPIGFLVYMIYQATTAGDPLAFYHLQKIVGEQHQSGITLLPQVWFRYIKILLTTDITNPIYPTMILEFVTGVLFFVLPIYGFFKKMRLSYVFYAIVGFVLPTIQGSFSSQPRYILVLFPAFLALAIFLSGAVKWIKVSYLLLSLVGLIFATAFFLRGYWVA